MIFNQNKTNLHIIIHPHPCVSVLSMNVSSFCNSFVFQRFSSPCFADISQCRTMTVLSNYNTATVEVECQIQITQENAIAA